MRAPPSGGDVTSLQSAVTGNIVISGRVTNSSGGGLSNVTVTLAGSASTSQQTTRTGAYSFGGLATGSYSVRPTRDELRLLADRREPQQSQRQRDAELRRQRVRAACPTHRRAGVTRKDMSLHTRT